MKGIIGRESRQESGRKAMLAMLCILVTAFALASCATTLPPIRDDISSAELIQKAQERTDSYDWKGAKYYYMALLEKFPNDGTLVVTAMYELAFIEHKQGHTEAARAGFQAVLEKYSAPEGSTLPQTWKILSEKVLAGLPKAPAK